MDPRERGEKLRWAPYVPRASCPDDVAACALLAADVKGVERAEASGRAFAAALRPWGAPAADTVLWVPTSRQGYGYQLHDTKPDVWEPDAFALFVSRVTRWEEVSQVIDRLAGEAAVASMDPDHRAFAAGVAGVWAFAKERWADAVSTQQRVPRGEKAEGRSYADLPDPFVSVLELLGAGYGPLPSGDGVLVPGYPVD